MKPKDSLQCIETLPTLYISNSWISQSTPYLVKIKFSIVLTSTSRSIASLLLFFFWLIQALHALYDHPIATYQIRKFGQGLKKTERYPFYIFSDEKKVKLSCNRPWCPIWLSEVEAHIFTRQSAHRWRWGSQPYAPAALYSQEDSWYSFLLETGGRIR
jgi:hypothetical protein